MAEKLRAAAVGYALVDHKIVDSDAVLPDASHTAAQGFLNNRSTVFRRAGGSVATTMAAYERYSGNPTRLFYRVANDYDGELFYRETGPQVGAPQMVEDGHTGMCVLAIDEQNGEIADEITVYGVASAVTVPRDEIFEPNDLVVSNVNTLRNPLVYDQTTALLNRLDRRKGIFAFRLSGAHDLLASGEEARAVVDSLPVTPDIVFGNAAEVENILGHEDHERAVRQILPDSRVLILTRGSKETIIRFEDVVSHLPAIAVDDVVDVTAAGDHKMGVTLGELMQLEPRLWTADGVRQAVYVGSIAASAVIQSIDSRLSRDQLGRIRSRYGRS